MLAIEVFRIRPRKLRRWQSLEVAEIEAYFLIKEERLRERDAERERQGRMNKQGAGQGRRAPTLGGRRRRR